MAEKNYQIRDVYQGSYSSLSPKYGSIFGDTYRVTASQFGLTTDPQTANQLQDVSTKLNTGVGKMMLTLVSPQVFDAMSTQQLKEINRLSKLTGVEMSIHAPVIDSTGVTREGFSESNRFSAEKKIADALIRSHEINPDGNVQVTFHAAEGLSGSEWIKIPDKEKGFEGEARRIIAVDRDTGRMLPVEKNIRYHPGEGEGGRVGESLSSAEDELDTANRSEWDNKISQLFFNKERADEILQQNAVQIQHVQDYIEDAKRKGEKAVLTQTQEQAYLKKTDAENYLKDIHMHASTYFSKAYEFGSEEQRAKLQELSKDYAERIEKEGGNIMGQSRAMHELLIELQNQKNKLAPRMFVPVEEFAVDKSSQTFGNAALEAYKKFGDKTPLLLIENPPAGFGLSTGEDLKNLVVASRKKFVENAVKSKSDGGLGISEGEAENKAEKFIGAVWDVSHINMLRKYGLGKEEIIRETEKIAPFVRTVHLADNFGMEHTELPMGMGNVPMKEIMDKLGKEGFDATKIIEAGTWWQHFKTPPFKETLEVFGSAIYTGGMGPYWNQNVGLQRNYFGGYGTMLPQMNYETFGAGFSRLPSELGGSRGGGEGSRMSGRGME